MRLLALLLVWLITATTCPAEEAAQGVSYKSHLLFFKRHQSPDGSWNPLTYADQCTDGEPKCEPGQGGPDDVIAVTAQVVLCFLEEGYDHKMPSWNKTTVQKGLSWLLAQEKDRGAFGTTVEAQALAAHVLSDAFGCSLDTTLREPAQRAIDRLLALRLGAVDGKPLAWGDAKTHVFDTSLTSEACAALVAAKGAGLPVGDSVAQIKIWWSSAWKAANPRWESITDPYVQRSTFPAQWSETTGAVDEDLTAGARIATWTGGHRQDVTLGTLINAVVDKYLPHGNDLPTDLRATLYGSQAIYEIGTDWDKWCGGLCALHGNRTPREGEKSCLYGSINPDQQTYANHSRGRLQSTIYYSRSGSVLYAYHRLGPK